MENRSTELPWEALRHTEGGIPWSALSEFGAAVVRERSLTDDLFELYEQAYESECDHAHYEEYYVPAIFALAAPQLSDERRREIGSFLIEKLSEAGYDSAEISMEVLTAACGSMGPVILPAVLDAIENEPDMDGAWFHLWGLTELAARTEDPEVRDPVIKACTDLLQEAERGQIEPLDAMNAAWTLAYTKCSDSIGLLQRLKVRAAKSLAYGDYADALDLLQGCLKYTPPARLWEMPVREWFEPRWRMARDWFIKYGHECDDDETDAGTQHANELASQFMESSEAAELGDDVLEDAGFVVASVLGYAWDYVGVGPGELDEDSLSEVLLELLPRKVTAERGFFESVAPVTAALLQWLESEGILDDTADLVEAVRGWADAIVINGMDPGCWGLGKSFAMRALADGVDMLDEKAVQEYMAKYNRRILADRSPDPIEFGGFAPPVPIVENSPKIGRNEPCPCGSGKKYKKCCGSPNNVNTNG